MPTGAAKWFNNEKGYGIIARDDGAGDFGGEEGRGSGGRARSGRGDGESCWPPGTLCTVPSGTGVDMARLASSNQGPSEPTARSAQTWSAGSGLVALASRTIFR